MPKPPTTDNGRALFPDDSQLLGRQKWPHDCPEDGVFSRVVGMKIDGASMHWIAMKHQGFTVRHVGVVWVRATGRIFAYYRQRTPGAGSMSWDVVHQKHLIGRRL